MVDGGAINSKTMYYARWECMKCVPGIVFTAYKSIKRSIGSISTSVPPSLPPSLPLQILIQSLQDCLHGIEQQASYKYVDIYMHVHVVRKGSEVKQCGKTVQTINSLP